jgi:hypothetical protein
MRVLKRSSWRGYGNTRQVGLNCSIVLSELVTAAGDIPDAIGWQMGVSYMIECKASRSDFFADARKPQRLAGTGAGEHRYFMVPLGMITPTELPPEWGLLEVDGKQVTETVRAERRKLDTAGHIQEKRMLLSTISRIRTREFLIISAEHLDVTLDQMESALVSPVTP